MYIWGSSFRAEYQNLYRLFILLSTRPSSRPAQWLLTSATLNLSMINSITSLLKMPSLTFSEKAVTRWFQRSNERPNLYFAVMRMERSLSSFGDLARFVPANLSPRDSQPTSFIAFFNSRNTAMAACKWARSRVSSESRNRYVWVHAGMSDEHKESVVREYDNGELLGVFGTEALGMVRCLSLTHDQTSANRLVVS